MNLGSSNNPPTLNFSVILDQKNGKLTLKESGLLTLEIPKHWQKTDTDTKNPALWICHLPENSLGIVSINFYPTELEVKKKVSNNSNPLTYRGSLEITSESEEKIFYRCELKLIEERRSGSGFLLWFLIVVGVLALIAFTSSKN